MESTSLPAVDGNPGRSPAQLTSDQNPTLEVLVRVVRRGECVRLDKIPPILANLHDPEYRIDLGLLVAGGRRDTNSALTEWLHLASVYQELCNLRGDPKTDAQTYIEDSVPLSEDSIDRALAQRNCRFLTSVHAQASWPYEVRLGTEILARDFKNAEVTRRLWVDVLQSFHMNCGVDLSRRDKIAIDAQLERLGRIVGLDDPTLIELRTNMLAALEAGDEKKVVAYATAISERETALDSRGAAVYAAKLAAIQSTVSAQAQELERTRLAGAGSQAAQVSGDAAQAAKNTAQTAQNVAQTAQAAKATVSVLRSLF